VFYVSTFLKVFFYTCIDLLSREHGTIVIQRASNDFYRAMHFSAKRGIAIACRLSVCLSVCNVGEL